LLYAGFYYVSDERTGEGKDIGVWTYDGNTWTGTDGGVSSFAAISLACDSTHNVLYAGCSEIHRDRIHEDSVNRKGVWKYNP